VSRFRATAILLLIISVARAQHSGIGIKAGAVASRTKSGNNLTSAIPGAAAGIYFPLRAGPRMELQPELLITTMGANYPLQEGARGSLRTVYISLPVSLKMYIGNVFNAQAGFQMQRLLTAQQSGPEGIATVTDSYAHWDYGAQLGLGADMARGLDLGLRCYTGFSPIQTDGALSSARNQALMLSLGYRVSRLRAPKATLRRR
jgi:hypothetical protein